jgi:putative hydrolase
MSNGSGSGDGPLDRAGDDHPDRPEDSGSADDVGRTGDGGRSGDAAGRDDEAGGNDDESWLGGPSSANEDAPPADPLGGLLAAMLGGAGGASGGLGGLPPGLAGLNLPGMPNDPQALQAMLATVQQLLVGGDEGPVNWDLARSVARQTSAEQGDPSVGEAQQRRVAEALRTADLWLDRVCELPAATARTEAWSRAEWIENTLPTWRVVVEPVAASVGEAMAAAMAEQAPPELRPMLSGALPMMRKMGGTFFGAQLGQALGALAGEVVGGGDVGLPLLPAGRAALIPVNVAAFGAGLGLPDDEVRLYLALREAAHARLVAGVPWLRAHLLAAVGDYSRGIVIDTSRIEAAVRDLDLSDPEALQQALASDLFEPERTPAQQAALDRLETALALVEGWVDEVVDLAARDTLPHTAALRESVRRRRAVGGPAEHTFASLVGLELRPRRLREAAAVWAALTEARGASGRGARWAHPDIAPGEEAFADPRGFAADGDAAADDMDAALERLLDEGDGPPGDTPGDGTPGDDRPGNGGR